ncbi:FMN-binding negative transcriptional regulator [Scleromatobacter humisilvae]|uniref:FMN-binding negative transcriptional regulator n=1 Tax=Scleromatobacter humisilvae TaxID=2897159 RepID=A0A9X1YI95_9BURK|nr:FMN-binding negative transcriptional regulator [Scleromatobacter humisilvae]MCK9685360.1 FMN-binding negative transcriptional regulator [Scleromatobacter humisilvae]
MIVTRTYQPKDATEIERLVGEHPFGLVVSSGAGLPMATPLPLLLEQSDDGGACLVGHFAKVNPQVDLLRASPRALVAFMGVNGYVSPSWMTDRTQAPTWNYETVHFEVDVQFDSRPLATRHALERLVAHVEGARPNAWRIEDMGPRYERLAGAVIAFRAKIIATHAKFKLGQNERPDVYEEILNGLESNGGHDLAAAMRRAARSGSQTPMQ